MFHVIGACKGTSLRSRVWTALRPTENDSTVCTKMAISLLLLGVANSNLVDRKSKYYFIIKFNVLLSTRLCWKEIRVYAGKTTDKSLLQVFSEMTIVYNFLS